MVEGRREGADRPMWHQQTKLAATGPKTRQNRKTQPNGLPHHLMDGNYAIDQVLIS